MTRATLSRRRLAVLWPVLLGLVVAAALAARALPARSTVFAEDGRVRLLGGDAFYSLRHMRFSAGHFPAVQRWDVGTRYPTGMRSYTTGLYELGAAAVAWALGAGRPDPGLVDAVAAWSPAILGALSLLALFRLVRQAGRPRLAWLACLFFAVHPGRSLPRTTLGFADHHAAEILLLLLSVGGLLRALRTGARWRAAFLCALPLALFHFTWNGAPLHVILLAVSVVVLLLFEVAADPAGGGETASTASRYFLVLALEVGAIGVIFPSWVLEPDHLPATVGLCLGAAVALPVLHHAGGFLTGRRLGRPLAALALAATGAGLVVAAVAVLPLGDLLERVFGTKSALVAEHKPVRWSSLLEDHGLLAVLMVWALPVTLYEAVRWPRARRRLLLALFGTALVLLWWRTHDYDYAAAPFVAILAALAFHGTWRMLDLPVLRRVPVRAAAVALLVILPIVPLGWSHGPWLSPEEVRGYRIAGDGWLEAMDWLREETPAPSLPVDAAVPPFGPDFAYPEGTYGVFTAWDYGNLAGAIGRRPSVWSQGLNETTTRWFTLADEADSVAWLGRRCRGPEEVRYVVVDARSLGAGYLSKATSVGLPASRFFAPLGTVRAGGRALELFGFGERFERSVAWRLYRHEGTGLGRYRLVFASRSRSLTGYRQGGRRLARVTRPAPDAGPDDPLTVARGLGPLLPAEVGFVHSAVVTSTVKIFEVVPGAEIRGRAHPGTEVGLRLALLERGTGRRFEYERTTRADAEGAFSLRVPHATCIPGPGSRVRAEGGYRLLRDGLEIRRVEVTEDDVRGGGVVDLGRIEPPR